MNTTGKGYGVLQLIYRSVWPSFELLFRTNKGALLSTCCMFLSVGESKQIQEGEDCRGCYTVILSLNPVHWTSSSRLTGIQLQYGPFADYGDPVG